MIRKLDIKKITFYVILICIPLVFLELSLRVFFAVRVGPDILLYGTRFCCGSQKSFDPRGAARREAEVSHTVAVHENRAGNYSKYFPNQVRTDHDENGEVFKVTINDRGFRGEDFSDRKGEGVIRVITLGASSTFGYHNRDDETYPYYMESLLNQRCKGKTFEVINFGVPHLKSDNIYSLFLSEAVELDPDIVTFYEGVNDSQMGTDLRGLAKKSPAAFKALFYELRDRLITLALVENWIMSYKKISASDFYKQVGSPQQAPDGGATGQPPQDTGGDHENTQEASRLSERSEYFLRNVSLIHEECEKRGILFIVANQQTKSSYFLSKEDIKGVTYGEEVELLKNKLAEEGELSQDEVFFLTHAVMMKDLKDWALANHVPFADVIKALDQDRDCLLSWVHLNPRGNRIVASEFTGEILKHVDCDGFEN